MSDAFNGIQMVLQAGAFGVLILLIWKVPVWMKEARDSRQKEMELQSKERKEERQARADDAREEREARHSLANQFHQSIISALAANAQANAQSRKEDHEQRAEDRKAFEGRNENVIRALQEQTSVLGNKLDSLSSHLAEVKELVVRAEHVTVEAPKEK